MDPSIYSHCRPIREAGIFILVLANNNAKAKKALVTPLRSRGFKNEAVAIMAVQGF